MMGNDHITLNECTKADLRWIIYRVLQMTTLNNANYYINRALSDLCFEKEKQRLDEGGKYLELSNAKLHEYSSLMQQYQGKSLLEIPDGVLKKAAQLLKEADAADKKWRKSFGLKGA